MLLICGLPNAGKTTYSARFDNVLHLDEFIGNPSKYKACIEAAKNASFDIIIEGLFTERKKRTDLFEAIKDKPGERVCIWIDTPADECIRRENRGRHPSVVEHHARIFEPPTYDEGWDEIIRITAEETSAF